MNDGDPLIIEVLEDARQYDTANLARIMPAIRRCRVEWAVSQATDTTRDPQAREEFMNHLSDVWGFELDTKEVEGNPFYVPQYHITDEKKFTMFLLRWA